MPMIYAEHSPMGPQDVDRYLATGQLPDTWKLVREGDYKTMYYDLTTDLYRSVYDFSVIPPKYNIREDQLIQEVHFEAEALLAELVGLSRFEEAQHIRWAYKEGRGIMSAPNLGRHTEDDVNTWNTNGRSPALLPFTAPDFYKLCDVLAQMNHVAGDIHIDDMVSHPVHGIAFVDLVSRFGGCEDRILLAESLAELAIEMGFSFDEAHPLLQHVFTDFRYRRPIKERLLWERGVNLHRAKSVSLSPIQSLVTFEGDEFEIETYRESQFIIGKYEAFWRIDFPVDNVEKFFWMKKLPFNWINQWVATTDEYTTVLYVRGPTTKEERCKVAREL